MLAAREVVLVEEMPAEASEAVRATEDFGAFVSRYQDMIYALLLRMTGGQPAVAEELAQDTFVRAHRALPRFRGESKLSTWLTRIAINVGKSYLGSRRGRERALIESFDTQRHEPAMRGALEPDNSAEMARVRRALDRLDPNAKDVVVLLGIEGRSYRDVSEILQIPMGTVASRFNRALAALRKILDEEV